MASPLSYTFTPPAYYPTSTSSPTYHPALHYRPSIPPDYLPNDEYRYLVKQQHRSRLEAHFAQPSLSSTRNTIPKTPYQKQGTYTDTKPLPPYKPSLPPPERRDSGFEEKTVCEPTPQLQSKFSWDNLNDTDDKSPKRRSFWSRHRRSKSVEATQVPEKKKKRRTW
ncbi:hypothetical protein J4E86_005567 [Alternaria arbusti]|uniref:uncharacterized protein n=1 Tax=Alternaria arbusti TaxID=232088 RepID=UPI00221F6ABA|nr:uncharacterized protein J4E86_005567 [Alternaria arbusti]KAI4957094.1 hypothetical protein J4E86_005567 [Alternaria arbusti]